MYCKFHPTVEAVTQCPVCGADMCAQCNKDSFYTDENGNALCLECSLKEAESKLYTEKGSYKESSIKGSIAAAVWLLGLILGGEVAEFLYFIILIPPFIYWGKYFFLSTEENFMDKLKQYGWRMLLWILACPICVIFNLVTDRIDIMKINKKIKKIKAGLGIIK